MKKSIHSPEYKTLVRMMREAREEKDVTQAVIADRLGITPSQLSKWERLERRVDAWELRQYCEAAEIDFIDLLERWLRGARTHRSP